MTNQQILVGDYVVKKYQSRAALIKTGGVVISIKDNVAILSDGKNTRGYLLQQLTHFKKHHNTILGVLLYV